MKNFVSVSTSAARYQDISLNPQKLAGQCAKLKCCMNYEVDAYVEAGKRLPSREISLLTQAGEYYFFKADILSGMVTYSTDKNLAANLVTIHAKRAFAVISMNRKGEKPETLSEGNGNVPSKTIDLVEQESLTRFDKRKKKNRNRKDGNKRNSLPENIKVDHVQNEKSAEMNKPVVGNSEESASSDNRNMREYRKRNRPAQKENRESAENRKPKRNRDNRNRNQASDVKNAKKNNEKNA